MQDRNVLLYEPIAARTGPEKPKQLTAASHTCQSGLYLTPPVRFAEVRPSNAPHCTGRESWHSKLRCCFFCFFYGGGGVFWIGGRILARTRRLELLGIVGYNTKSWWDPGVCFLSGSICAQTSRHTEHVQTDWLWCHCPLPSGLCIFGRNPSK